MALTRDKERLMHLAALDTSKKIRLEPFLASDMRRMFKNMLHDFRLTYPAHQETITPDKYLSDTVAILRRHYRKVVKSFAGDLQNEVARTRKAKPRTDITDAVEREMFNYTLNHSETQARIIIKTTVNDLNDQINKVVTESVLKGEKLSPKKISDLVYTDYSKKINGRSNIIAMTETQSIAERTKNVEAKELQDSDYFSKKNLAKSWVAILDNVTREWHAEADGQIVGLEEPFTVNGESLYYPGDPSGSPENIINCRCSAISIER